MDFSGYFLFSEVEICDKRKIEFFERKKKSSRKNCHKNVNKIYLHPDKKVFPPLENKHLHIFFFISLMVKSYDACVVGSV